MQSGGKKSIACQRQLGRSVFEGIELHGPTETWPLPFETSRRHIREGATIVLYLLSGATIRLGNFSGAIGVAGNCAGITTEAHPIGSSFPQGNV